MTNIDYRQLLEKLLLKKAKGFLVKEKQEEFSFSDGEKRLVKRKITVRQTPPDVDAVKQLLELNKDKDISEMTDEELVSEKKRLISLLEESIAPLSAEDKEKK